ncbi:MAG: hypothetical protein P8I25_02595 [Ilumatobacter sp.]|nr:hypothetical protein [Ilumatobacter sp.]
MLVPRGLGTSTCSGTSFDNSGDNGEALFFLGFRTGLGGTVCLGRLAAGGAAAFFDAAFFFETGAACFAGAFFTAVFFAGVFLATAFLVAVFFGTAFLAAAFFGTAFLVAAFLAAGAFAADFFFVDVFDFFGAAINAPHGGIGRWTLPEQVCDCAYSD